MKSKKSSSVKRREIRNLMNNRLYSGVANQGIISGRGTTGMMNESMTSFYTSP